MRLGSRSLGLLIGVLTLLIFLFGEVLPHLGPAAATAPPESLGPDSSRADSGAFLQAQFANLPAWVVVWMAFQDIIMASSLFFVLWKKEAQVYAAGIVASHVFFYGWAGAGPIETLSINLAAFSHWLWIPALIYLCRNWPKLEWGAGYKTWVTIAIAQLIFALGFDIPDGAKFLLTLF